LEEEWTLSRLQQAGEEKTKRAFPMHVKQCKTDGERNENQGGQRSTQGIIGDKQNGRKILGEVSWTGKREERR